MAELLQQNNRGKKGIRRSKKLSTRVDLTPMVDLGFLLITFFIFTTTLSEANAMGIVIPSDKKPNTDSKTPESKTISLILSSNNTIQYYHGTAINNISITTYAANGLRHIILQKQKALGSYAKEMVVLIKPTKQASYGNVVDVLDEMQINGVTKYVLMELDGSEKLLDN